MNVNTQIREFLAVSTILTKSSLWLYRRKNEKTIRAGNKNLEKNILPISRRLCYTYSSRISLSARENELAQDDKREKMIKLITEYGIKVLEPDVEASRLADMYISEGVIPKRYRTDGLHIAIAVVYGLDLVISMNFQHIVKHKTEKMTGAINTLNGYRAVEIVSPMEVIENENI